MIYMCVCVCLTDMGFPQMPQEKLNNSHWEGVSWNRGSDAWFRMESPSPIEILRATHHFRKPGNPHPQVLHGAGIFTYIEVIYGVNVDKYAIHGACGIWYSHGSCISTGPCRTRQAPKGSPHEGNLLLAERLSWRRLVRLRYVCPLKITKGTSIYEDIL